MDHSRQGVRRPSSPPGATRHDTPAARKSVRRSAVAQTPRDQETGLGDIELRETGLDFDESHVYAGRPSVFSGAQVAGSAPAAPLPADAKQSPLAAVFPMIQ